MRPVDRGVVSRYESGKLLPKSRRVVDRLLGPLKLDAVERDTLYRLLVDDHIARIHKEFGL